MNKQISNKVVVAGNRVWMNGNELPPCPSAGRNVTVIDGNVYIDGYEYRSGKWKRTLKALWHKLF